MDVRGPWRFFSGRLCGPGDVLAGVPVGTDCPLGSPREIYRTDLDLGAGFAAGVVGGYRWPWIRVEADLRQYTGSSTSLVASVDHLVAVRSREPLLADGVTPYDLGLKLDGFRYVLLPWGSSTTSESPVGW